MLSCQAELDAQAEVLRRCGVGAAAQERRVGLTVEVETHGQQARQRVFGRERQFEGGVATRCVRHDGGDIAGDGCLLTVGQVEAQVEVVVRAVARGARRGLSVVLIVVLLVASAALDGSAHL